MKFTGTQENILHALSKVAPVAGKNNQLPSLNCVLLSTMHNILECTTTDLEIGVRAIAGGKVGSKGKCAVPARGLLDYVQQLPKSNPVTLEQKEGGLLVTTQGFFARFPVANPDEFPLLPEEGEGEVLSVRAQVFCLALDSVVFSAAREDTRPEIRSVFLNSEGKDVRVAATDSFRLAEKRIRLSSGEGFSLLLPLASAHEIIRLFSDQGEVELVYYGNHVTVKGEGVELSSRLVDGQYPDYQQIIPTSQKTLITLPCSDFTRALKTLMVFLPRDSRRIKLSVDTEKGELVAVVAGGEAGQGEVKLSFDGEGESVEVLVNVQYLLEGIQRIKSDRCDIRFSGPQNPVVFHPAGKAGEYVYVVMPIQAD